MRLVKLAALAAVLSVPVAAQAGGAEMSLVPQGSAMVVHVDMARLRNSSFYKTIISSFLNSPAFKGQIDMAKKQAGFDPVNDLNSMTLVMPKNMKGGEPLVMLDGKVDAKAIGAKVGKGAQVISAKNRVVIGKPATVKAAQAGGGAAALQGLLSKTNQKADIWFVANLPPEMQQQMARGNPMAKDISAVRGSVDFAKGINLKMAMKTPNAKKMEAEASKALAQALKEPMLTQMGLAPILQKLNVKAAGSDLSIALDLNDAEVGKLQAMVQMMMMMGGAKGAPKGAK